jgi:hypothetical protein
MQTLEAELTKLSETNEKLKKKAASKTSEAIDASLKERV